MEIEDSRDLAKVSYPIRPTLFAIMLAWMCGYNSSVQVAMFWEFKFKTLKRLIPDFPDSLISHDTVNRLLSLIVVDDLKAIMSHFSELVVRNNKNDELGIKHILSLDGQTPKAAEYEPGKGFCGHSNADKRLHQKLYYVTLFDSTNALSLTMEEVESKENENNACVRAIKMFDLAGTIVTADALNTRRSIAEAVTERGGDYVLALKDNHKSLRMAAADALSNPFLMEQYGRTFETEAEMSHGRVEEMSVLALPISAVPDKKPIKDWKKDAHTVFMAVTESFDKKHQVARKPEVRLFISSLSFDHPDIAALGYRAIREHWHIENKLHWCLDMDFGQDHMQIKNRNYLRNCEALSRIALNAIRQLEPKFRKPTRNENVALCHVQGYLDANLGENIREVAKLFVEGTI